MIRTLTHSITKMDSSFNLEALASSLPEDLAASARKFLQTFLGDLLTTHRQMQRRIKHKIKSSFQSSAPAGHAEPCGDTKGRIKYKHLECVLRMKEPNSIEIAHLHEFIAFIFSEFNLRDSLTSDFFGFEQKKLGSGTEMIISFLESIQTDPKQTPIFKCKQLILGLLSCIYLRLYDTRRFGIYLTMWGLMQAICRTITKLRVPFETDNEGMVLVNVMSVIVQRAKSLWEFITSNR